MNLLVGATGFIGGHLVGYLLEQGEISKATFRMGSHLKLMDASGVQGIEADLLDHHSLHEAMEGVDSVYNLASPMPGSDTEFQKMNTEGVLNLLETSAEAGVKTFVQLSTLDVYGFRNKTVDGSTPLSPSDDYQRSKAEAERLLFEFSKRNASPKVSVIRSAKAVGSRDESLVLPILRMMKDGRVVLPSSGTMSFTHPRDVSQAMYRAATNNIATGSTYLVKSFDASPEQLAESLAAELGTRASVKKQGMFGSSPVPRYTSEQLKASMTIGVQKNWAEIGYAPLYDLKGTSQEIASWYRKEPWATEAA